MPGSCTRDAEFKYDVIPLCMRIAKGMFFHQVFLRGIGDHLFIMVKIQKFHICLLMQRTQRIELE